MQSLPWLNWVVPGLLGTVITVCGALIKLWGEVGVHREKLEQFAVAVEEEKRRNEVQDLRLGEQDRILVRIDENVKTIKEILKHP